MWNEGEGGSVVRVRVGVEVRVRVEWSGVRVGWWK